MILLGLGLGTLFTGAVLWVAIRIVAPSNERNTPAATFLLGGVLTALSLIPIYGLVAVIAILFVVLVKLYDLGIGQTLIVLILLVASSVALRVALAALVGGE